MAIDEMAQRLRAAAEGRRDPDTLIIARTDGQASAASRAGLRRPDLSARLPGPRTPVNQYWAAYVDVDDAGALHRKYAAAGVEMVRGPEDMFYGCRDSDIRDPDGPLIAFGHDLAPTPAGPGTR